MPTISEALAVALQHQQAGRLQDAEQIYRQVLAVDQNNADAQHLLGVIALQKGEHGTALEYISRAIELNGTEPVFHCNLGNTFQAQGKLDKAVECFRRALELKPDRAEVDSHIVHAFFDLGSAFRAKGELKEAIACFRAVLEHTPDSVEAHNRLGNAFKADGRLDEAIDCFRHALELKPDLPELHYNLGTALQDQRMLEEAAACFRMALKLKPDLAEAHSNLGAVFHAQARLSEATVAYDKALRLKPDFAEARYNQSLLMLQSGDFERGWREYEWRFHCQGFHRSAPTPPVWDSLPAHDRKTILLHTEQGLGDTLQFIRYAPLVKQRGGEVSLRCSKELIPLLSRCRGLDRLISSDDALPARDVELHLTSLPLVFHTTLETVPREVPYLFADPKLVERWRRDLPPGQIRIGIAWQGNPKHVHDKTRSIPLAQFASLARVPGVRLISLQKGFGSEQLAGIKDQFSVHELEERFDESGGTLMDTAAIMQNLDLVIAPDTSIVHLAGGLGVPVWLALSFTHDWRWLLDRNDSPWYPTMRLFHQKQPGDWAGVLEEIRAALHQMMLRQ